MIKAKKRFGQNFLKDETVLNKIIQAMPNDKRKIVEIGPGLGDLTKKLLEKGDVVAFEVDEELCRYLKKKFEKELENSRLILKCGDVLKHWEEGMLIDEEYNLVANLPYYIATTIILKALHDFKCKSILAMVQKEVARKFVALPKEKDFSSLSVICDSVSKRKLLFDVEPHSFTPAPKVISAVLNLQKKCEFIKGEYPGIFENLSLLVAFENFLKISFASPRKTLRKNLVSFYNKEQILKSFKSLNIDIKLRPHELSTLDYHLLFKHLHP